MSSDKIYSGTLSGLSGRHGWIEFDYVPMLTTGIKVDVKIHENTRSKNANAYFHKLVSLIADAMKESKHYVKNKMVGEYGQMTFYNGDIVTFTTLLPPEQVHYWEQDKQHLWLSQTTYQDGKIWYSYRVYKKTSEMTTREFSILLDGTIREAQDLGIETMTPDELIRFKDYERQSNLHSMRS